MKKLKFIALSLALVLSLGMAACNNDDKNKIDPNNFVDWVSDNGIWRTVEKTSFKDGKDNRPSDADIKTISKAISMTPTSVGKTDYLCVILTDKRQQIDVVGEGNANDGTVTILVFGDRLYAKEESAAGTTQQLDRGYYNVGIASGYANLAAISLGYGTHFYMTTEYTKAGAVKGTTEDAYLKGQNYKYKSGENEIDAYGNVKFVCAIVVGTKAGDPEANVTDHKYPTNVVVAKEGPAPVVPTPEEPDVPNPDVPNPDQPNPDQPNPDQPNPDVPNPDQPNPDNPNPENPDNGGDNNPADPGNGDDTPNPVIGDPEEPVVPPMPEPRIGFVERNR